MSVAAEDLATPPCVAWDGGGRVAVGSAASGTIQENSVRLLVSAIDVSSYSDSRSGFGLLLSRAGAGIALSPVAPSGHGLRRDHA